ncbi:MAG: glycosyltransferase [Marinobacter sp.]|uniref:glycosyltransferase family 2 protein n=1 Tax=Marinobacter sp. TaxID=50741 RepID=UPI00396E3ADF
MESEPLVSVVIATYNMGQYLPLAVESVLNQDWSNLELIVVDDGSTDDTPVFMRKFAIDSRVNYIRTENQGQPKAKNRGISEAKGEFIGFCDADDIWQPQKLSMQVPHFIDPTVGVVYSEVSYIDQFGEPISQSTHEHRHEGKITDSLLIKNFIPFGTAVIRKECIEKNGTFDEELPMGIDWDLWLRYSVNWDFKYEPAKTYVYRVWPGQMSKNYRGRYDNAFKILRNFLEKFPNNTPDYVVSRAWADMYVSRGLAIARAERTFVEPLRDIVTGLGQDVGYGRAWRSLIKLLLRRF